MKSRNSKKKRTKRQLSCQSGRENMEKGDFAPKNRETKEKQAYPAERFLLKSKEICGICLFWCRGFKNQY